MVEPKNNWISENSFSGYLKIFKPVFSLRALFDKAVYALRALFHKTIYALQTLYTMLRVFIYYLMYNFVKLS